MSPEIANTSSNSCSVAPTMSNANASSSGPDPDLSVAPNDLALGSGPDLAPGGPCPQSQALKQTWIWLWPPVAASLSMAQNLAESLFQP